MSRREAEAAKELLLTRMMSVHPEVYGGGRVVEDRNGLRIVVELSEQFPDYVRPSDTFMNYPVEYKVTGWKPDLMPYHQEDYY